MNRIKRGLALISIAVLGVIAFAGCSEDSSETTGATVRIATGNWAEGIALTHLAEAILIDEMGYDVDVAMADAGMIFASVADGDYDLYLDAWLPDTQRNYMEEYGDRLEDLGYNFEGAKVSVGVPAYVEGVDSIEDLRGRAEEFDGQIIGIDAGAEMMRSLNYVVEEYDLDGFEVISGSEPAMTAQLKSSIESEEPIAFLAWQPHWKFARWDIDMLEDPLKVFGEGDNIHSLSRIGFKDDMPEVAEFIENMYLEEDEIAEIMDDIEAGAEPIEAGRDWIEENREIVENWIPEV